MFILRYRNLNNQKKLFTIGPFPTLSLQQAKDIATKHLAAILAGEDPTVERQQQRMAETMADLCRDYIERYAKAHKKTWKEDQRRIDAHILPAWKNNKVKEISRNMVAQLHRKIGKQGKYEANRVLALLSKLFNLAIDWGYLEENHGNPAMRIKKFLECSLLSILLGMSQPCDCKTSD